LKVIFIDGTPGFDPQRLASKPTGGILSSLTILPRLLAQRGHDVWVKSVHTVSGKIDGVNYLSLTDGIEQADIVIFNRNVISRDVVAQAKSTGAKVLWWLHDVVDHRYLIDDGFTQVDGIIALSQYCKRTYSQFYGIPEEKFVVIPNGVDKDVFYPGRYEDRDPHLMVYASAPIKGLKPLGLLANNFKRLDPQNEVRMYASQTLHDKADDALIRFQLDQAKMQGVTVLDPIPQADLAEVMRKAWVLLMPNSYPEICSNLLLQARASGLPVVASPTGSIPEFLPRGGRITKSNPCDLYFWWKEFALLALELTVDRDTHQYLSNEAPHGVMSWEEVATEWDRYFGRVR
jgi:glycosyltransferase involved in cell wall biosynthesis